MNHGTIMTASVGSNQHAKAAWGWEKSGKAWSSSCLNTSSSCTKLRRCSPSGLLYRFLVEVCTCEPTLGQTFFSHMSWQETVPHCEQEMQMLPGCSISQWPFVFFKWCGTNPACESWLYINLMGEESQVQPGSNHDFHPRLKKEHQSMDEQLSLSKQQLYHAQDMLLLVS